MSYLPVENQRPAFDKGIPIPENRWGPKKTAKWRRFFLNEMEVGDSYFLAGDPHKARAELTVSAAQFRTEADRSGIKLAFTVRAVEGGARVWRTE